MHKDVPLSAFRRNEPEKMAMTGLSGRLAQYEGERVLFPDVGGSVGPLFRSTALRGTPGGCRRTDHRGQIENRKSDRIETKSKPSLFRTDEVFGSRRIDAFRTVPVRRHAGARRTGRGVDWRSERYDTEQGGGES